jgi:hypothetical protein
MEYLHVYLFGPFQAIIDESKGGRLREARRMGSACV